MQYSNKKTTATILALFLMIIFAIPYIPLANASTTYYYTHVFVADGAGPRGVGVGEPILLVSWTADMPADIGETRGLIASPSGRAGWYGMQIQVWDPDNVTEVIDMPYSDPVGANYISYTPEKVGTYRIQAIFPLTDKVQTVTAVSMFGGTTAGDHYIYTADTSPIGTFNVYSDATPQWIESPLPTGYWTRPISGAARQWYTIAGNWLGGAANQWPLGASGGTVGGNAGSFGGQGVYAWGAAPESAHILWSKPFFLGGITDERFGDSAGHTAHYQGVEFTPAIILDGKIHWSPRYTSQGNKGYEIIDLYTGQTLFLDWNATCPAFGQIYRYESPNQHGTFEYLWDTGVSSSFFGSSGKPIVLPQVVTVAQVMQANNLSVIRTGIPYKLNRTTTPLVTNTIWRMIDAKTGNTICYLANVSTSGTQVRGIDGSILYYNLLNLGSTTTPNYYCQVWNTSAGTMVASQAGTGYWQWRPAGGDFGGENPYFGNGNFFAPMTMDWDIVHDGRVFYSQNFSIPSLDGPRNSRLNETATVRAIRQDNYCIVGTQGINDERGVAPGWMMCFSLAPNSSRGTKLWESTFTPVFCPASQNITTAGMFTGGFSLNGVFPEDNVIVFSEVKQLKFWVFDLKSGTPLWSTPDNSISQYNYYGQSCEVINHKLIIYGGYSGEMRAYDIRTGNQSWVFDAKGIGSESPYGNYPITVSAISDDKIYTTSWEHSYTIPLIRGPNLRCINATDGTEIWSILDFGGGVAVADGRLICSNSMDNMIYCYGPGKSALTVSAPQTLGTVKTQVMLTGTITDDTPTGRRTANDAIDFTLKGTPAICDADMSRWMEYLFMEQVYPADAKGVEVTLVTIDPNGNYIPIGTTTSDINGNYGIPFSPDVPGNYQILATFAGTKSYGASTASTYMVVGDVPPVTDAPTATPATVTETYFVPAIAGLFAFTAIMSAIMILLLRKRP